MLDLSAITHIVFDLDDTLRFNEPHSHTFFTDHAESLGSPLDAKQRRASHIWEHSYWATSDDLIADLKQFGEGTESFWLNYSKRHLLALGFAKERAQALAAELHAHMRENYRPASLVYPQTLQALQALKAAGYHIGLLTNRPKPAHAEMHAIGLDTYLDFFLTASQLGAFKPSKEIFENLVRFLGIRPEQMVYVGDNYYADVIGARNADVLPILLNWNGLYSNVDCLEIKSISELLNILQPEPIS